MCILSFRRHYCLFIVQTMNCVDLIVLHFLICCKSVLIGIQIGPYCFFKCVILEQKFLEIAKCSVLEPLL